MRKRIVCNVAKSMILLSLLLLIKEIPFVNLRAENDAIKTFNSTSLVRYIPTKDDFKIYNRGESDIYYWDLSYEFLDGSSTIVRLFLKFYTETLYTPNGTDASMPLGLDPTEYLVFKYIVDLPTDIKNDIILCDSIKYSSIQNYGVPTTSYNCHSYAWNNQNILTNDIWLNYPTAYCIDSSYEIVEDNPRIGDIICYFDNNNTPNNLNDDVNLHSGLIVGLSGETSNGVCGDANVYTVKSKWGLGALYTHKGDVCPYTSTYGGTSDYVVYYRPKKDATYNLTQYGATIDKSLTANGNSTDVTDKYDMYELNVSYSKTYQINISSDKELDVRLYDEHMQVLINNPTNNYANSTYTVSISPYLTSGERYYLRVAYQNITNSGTIATCILGHTHSYGSPYIWKDYTHHRSFCECGSMTLRPHAVRNSDLIGGNLYAKCIECGGDALVGIIQRSIDQYPTSSNGSYILPNGVIVLVDEDIEAYLEGILLFDYHNSKTFKYQYNSVCIVKRRENY